jgi:hypothetical protein
MACRCCEQRRIPAFVLRSLAERRAGLDRSFADNQSVAIRARIAALIFGLVWPASFPLLGMQRDPGRD